MKIHVPSMWGIFTGKLHFALEDFRNPPRFYVKSVPTISAQEYDDSQGPHELDRVERAALAAQFAEIGECPVTLWFRFQAAWREFRRLKMHFPGNIYCDDHCCFGCKLTPSEVKQLRAEWKARRRAEERAATVPSHVM